MPASCHAVTTTTRTIRAAPNQITLTAYESIESHVGVHDQRVGGAGPLDVAEDPGKHPMRGRLALGLALAYLVSPIQVIPNVIPVIGQTDDILVLMGALRSTCTHLPRGTVEDAWPGDPKYLNRLLGAPIPARTDIVDADAGFSNPPPTP